MRYFQVLLNVLQVPLILLTLFNFNIVQHNNILRNSIYNEHKKNTHDLDSPQHMTNIKNAANYNSQKIYPKQTYHCKFSRHLSWLDNFSQKIDG